jgi:MFS transporter, DHA1 family, inner membrane transport protein
VAAGLHIGAFNRGIALSAWLGGLIVEGMGLAAAPYFGGLIVAMGIALTRLSGRLNATVTPRRTVAAERYCNPAAHCRG